VPSAVEDQTLFWLSLRRQNIPATNQLVM